MIGVSYTGIGGRTSSFSANSGGDAMSALQRLQADAENLRTRMMQKRGGGGGGSAPATTNEQRRQRKERDRQAKYDRLAERGILREGKTGGSPFASALRRQKQDEATDLDRIDPRRTGKDITGGAKSKPEPTDSHRNAGDKTPFVESFISDLFLEQEEGVATLYKFRRRRSNTGAGRVFAVSKEECEIVGSIKVGGSGDGGGDGGDDGGGSDYDPYAEDEEEDHENDWSHDGVDGREPEGGMDGGGCNGWGGGPDTKDTPIDTWGADSCNELNGW